MCPLSDVAEELQLFQSKWDALTADAASPRTVMEVIEYSLTSQRKAEVYVNRLLRYLLDPEQPHGMDEEFLRAVLKGLPASMRFREDLHNLGEVSVADQVRVSDESGDRTGLVDLCIQVPNEWFLLVELKFGASDSQTEFYYGGATSIRDLPKSEFDSGGYYLYLHSADRETASEEEFANWTWQEFSDSVLRPFAQDNAAWLPQRTGTQLRELAADIQTITGMSDQQRHDREKVELYLDHYEAISDVVETFESRWNTFAEEWRTRLGDALNRDGYATYSTPAEDVTEVQLRSDVDVPRNWRFHTRNADWGMLFKSGWWRHTDDLRALYRRPDDRNDVRIGFHHRLNRNRTDAVQDHTLKFYFRTMGANDDQFQQRFNEAFDDRRDELSANLPGTAQLLSYKCNRIRSTYPIRVESTEDFFQAYIKALEQAFVDHVLEAPELIAEIDDVFQASIEDIYGTPPQ